MLVICFTNHALDQFLEGLMSRTDSIVRIGGQSKNENVMKFNIRNLRSLYHRNRHANELLWQKRTEFQDCLRRLNVLHKHLDAAMSYNCIVNYLYFAKEIPELGESWFKGDPTEFQNWLLGGRTNEDRLQEAVKHVTGKVQFNI